MVKIITTQEVEVKDETVAKAEVLKNTKEALERHYTLQGYKTCDIVSDLKKKIIENELTVHSQLEILIQINQFIQQQIDQANQRYIHAVRVSEEEK